MSTEEETRTSRKYDLTRTISKYLDLHMMFPLLDFVEISGIYPADQVAQARLDLLDATNMVSATFIRACPYLRVACWATFTLNACSCLPLPVWRGSHSFVTVYAVTLV